MRKYKKKMQMELPFIVHGSISILVDVCVCLVFVSVVCVCVCACDDNKKCKHEPKKLNVEETGRVVGRS